MPTSPRLAELGDFLAALHSGGIPVGPGEVARLQHLFACAPTLDRAGLKALLAALLVKNPAQRQSFDALFAAWCADGDADWPQEGSVADKTPLQAAGESASRSAAAAAGARHDGEHADAAVHATAVLPPKSPPPATGKWLLLAGAAVLALLALILAVVYWPSVSPQVAPAERMAKWQAPPAQTSQSDPDLPDQAVPEVWAWWIDPPAPQDIRREPTLGPLPLVILGGAALVIALAVCVLYRRRCRRIVPAPASDRGFGWYPLPPPARDDGALVDARARRQLVWNAGSFVADDPTRRLDLPRTVERTARAGGFVHFCFQPAVFERAIWFWLDRHLAPATASARELAAQLAATLRAAGLECRQGWFTDAPHRVDWPQQRGYRPVAEESPGRQAQVAIFADGDGLRRQLEHPLSSTETLRLLRALQNWPRLCFVDHSPDGEQIGALFARHGIALAVVRPPELAAWLGGAAGGRTAAVAEPFAPARQWAAAIALAGGCADTASAQTLRAVLALAASPWQVEQVLAAAAERRCRLIDWLLRSEPLGEDDLPKADSVARRALAWWQRRYVVADAEKCAQENPLLPWRGSLAQRRWKVEQALLTLYTDPITAADRLSQLAGKELREEIRHRLRAFVAADHHTRGAAAGENAEGSADGDADSQPIRLTWRFAAQPAPTQQRLRALGFAADLYRSEPPPLRLAPRLVLAAATLGALAAAAFAVAAHRWLAGDLPRLLPNDAQQNHPALAGQTLRLMEATTLTAYRLTLGNARETVTLEGVAARATVPVAWHWQARANAVHLAGGVLLRAGSLAQPIRACAKGWPQRSLAIVGAPADDAAARQLAIRLLDKGSADQVLLGPQWRAGDELARWLGSSEAARLQTQVLIVLPEGADGAPASALLAAHPGPAAIVISKDLAALARAIDFHGARMVEQAGLPWQVVAARGARIAGGPETRSENGIDWVAICPGTFTMGSRPGERFAQRDEIVDPPRVVTLSAFEIAASETTNAQYARIEREHEQTDERPVVNVTRQQARAFCRQVGGDLPSEAQWEYAARGGSQTAWSFGDDERRLALYAWFGEDWRSGVRPVRAKKANPLGLYDMHGNAWEWTRDWYAAYASGGFVDPERPEDDANTGWRVLRGGSFGDSPAGLRSALRVRGPPAFRDRHDGFRCVRVPPQP